VPALVFGNNRTGFDTQVTCNYGVPGSERNYRITVPQAGELTIDLTNLSFDAGFKPVIGVYTSCALTMQLPQGCLPPHPLEPVTHLVIPAIDAGSYVVAVDGFDLAMGDFSLAFCLRPTPVTQAGDTCANPAPLPLTNQHAYVEGNSLGMADDARLIRDNDVPCFGDVDRVFLLDLPDAGPGGLWDVHPRAWPLTDESFNPSLAITRECPVGATVIDGGVLECGVGMGPIAGHPFGASFAQHVPAGRHYLWLQGTESVAPRMQQAWALDVTYARVGSAPNDACSTSAPLLVPNATYAGTLVGATDTLSAVTCPDMSGQNGSGADVFYRYVAPATGMATFEVIGEIASTFYVGLFSGCGPMNCLTMVNPNGTQSQTRFTAPVVQGTTYYVMVEEYDVSTMPTPSIAYGFRGGFTISVSQ
jgi:hypothetical protein